MITLGPARLLRFRQRRLAQPPGAASRKNETSIISLSLAHIAGDIGWRTYRRAKNAEPNGHWQVAHPLRVACGTERTVLRDSRSRRGTQDLRIRGSYSPQFFLTRPILERGSQAANPAKSSNMQSRRCRRTRIAHVWPQAFTVPLAN
jgi:hypothetical protein